MDHLLKKIQLETKPCPLGCAAKGHIVLTGRDRLNGLPGEFTVVKCPKCGLLRTNPRPTPETIGFYYPNDYGPYQNTRMDPKKILKKHVPAWKRLLKRCIQLESRNLPSQSSGRMLEIGCASGAFLHKMAQNGWQVEGLEFSKESAKFAQALGYPVHVGSLEEAPDPQRSFDLIVGWMVLEHLHNPVLCLSKLHRWVRPGAWLALSVPDASSCGFRVFKDYWYALQLPTHLYHYTPKTIAKVLERGGWRLEKIFWQTSASNLLKSLHYVFSNGGWDRMAKLFSDLAEQRKHKIMVGLLGFFLGKMRASGRMIVWARRQND